LFFGVRGFAPVVGIAGLLCLPLARPSRRDWVGVLLLAALVLWAAVSTLWSPAESMAHSVKSISRLTILHLAAQLAFSAAFITALARLDSAGARKALTWIAFGFLAVLLLLTEEGVSHGALYLRLLALVHDSPGPGRVVRALAQGGYALAVAVWPLAMALHRQRRTWLALAMVAFVPLSMVLLRGFAPTAALAVSLPVFFLTRRYGRPAILVLAGLTVAYFLVTPLVMLAIDHGGLYASLKPHLPPSWAERLRIWSFVAERLAEHPLRGAGLDASRMFPGIVPLHPHNGALQLWFELGAPGALLGSAFWVWLWRRIGDCADRDRLYGAVAASTATVYLVIGAVGFGLWQEWWMCVGSFAMMLCILFGKTASRDEPAAGAARRK
jgi:O-antigen ligase